ncbi:2'-5' RNA ligase family protein [Candidatus Lokiarchaeum ossiferum]|uniref:2'-5' RNA ligase family protein n=1 Tax=Candidatus Lokiarchaeum ossiferum TaxID=2951803 RepID=UPI00352CE881
MSKGILLLFDENSSSILKKIYLKYQEHNLCDFMAKENIPAHITLAANDVIDFDLVSASIPQALSLFNPFKIRFASIGYFPATKIMFLNPKESEDLRLIQSLIQDIITDSLPDSISEGLYSSTVWIPHCTLANQIKSQKVSQIIDITQEMLDLQPDKPFIATVSAIALFKYPDFEIIKKWSLGG